VALVTGAARGIGAAIAAELSRRGDVVAGFDLSGEEGIYLCDVSDPARVEHCVALVESELGPIELLVNNAGLSVIAPSEELSDEVWRRQFAVMVDGAFYCARSVGKRMLARGRGSIVNITSINATEAFPGRLAYCAAKAALSMMTEVLAIEWAGRGIRVNAVAPGVVRTDLVDEAIRSGVVSEALYTSRTPVRRLGNPEEIARAVAFLASDHEAGFVTGTTLVVDGGWSAYGYAG